MPNCPTCGAEIAEGDEFCKQCGTKVTGSPEDQTKDESTAEDEVKDAVVKRLDAIKNKDEGAVRTLIDERYTKFDDWPPYRRQEATEALQNEFEAFKVLSDYSYELKDFKANITGDLAIATFTLHYQGRMRNMSFDVTSRATSVLRRQDSAWKVVHEHLSRFPEEMRQQRQQRQQFSRRRFPF